jgi:hypothetical protein
MAEGNQETGMPSLIKSIPSWDADKRGTTAVFFVVLLDGTCLFQSSGLNTQA